MTTLDKAPGEGAEPTTPPLPSPVSATRDRYFDLLRTAAIVRIVAYHMFPVAWLSMIFPAVGVMFALGGSLMAGSISRSATRAVTGRLRRLLPAVWAMAVILIAAMLVTGWPDRPGWSTMLLWVLPVAEPPAAAWAEPATGVLWYLVAYLWLVLLSPALWWLYRRARLATIMLPLLALAARPSLPFTFGDAAESVMTDVLTFGSCWMLGFAHRTGDLRRVPRMVLAVIAAAGVAAGAGWAILHPGEEGVALASEPLAYGGYSLGFVLVLLRFTPPMGWLERHRVVDAAVNVVNARAVTIYLWHNLAITAAIGVGDRLQVWRLGDTFSPAGYSAVALVLLTLTVLLIGWVEDVAARRRIRLVPWRRSTSKLSTTDRRR